jgi:translation elongation factor P/translation initiation factor 5A
VRGCVRRQSGDDRKPPRANTFCSWGGKPCYKYRARNLITRNKIDFVLKGTDSLPEADFAKRVVKLMYRDPTHLHLMDIKTMTSFNWRWKMHPSKYPT